MPFNICRMFSPFLVVSGNLMIRGIADQLLAILGCGSDRDGTAQPSDRINKGALGKGVANYRIGMGLTKYG
jgi:hypothetical protein